MKGQIQVWGAMCEPGWKSQDEKKVRAVIADLGYPATLCQTRTLYTGWGVREVTLREREAPPLSLPMWKIITVSAKTCKAVSRARTCPHSAGWALSIREQTAASYEVPAGTRRRYSGMCPRRRPLRWVPKRWGRWHKARRMGRMNSKVSSVEMFQL